VLLLSISVGSSKKPEERPQPKGKATTKPSTKAAKYLTLDVAKGVTMKLVLIPAGKFMMGSAESPETVARWSGGRAKWYKDEHPQHEVTISPGAPGFYMGVYEVTQEQYEAVIGKNPAKFKVAKNPAGFRGEKNPVEQVSWDDAVAFCKALSKKTGKTVRLPTEAEWEYACRVGTKTRFSSGNDEKQLGDYAWYSANSGRTHPVGRKKRNAWGLYDMHGNVWEWCGDWYADSYANAKAVDPQGPASGSARVVRGGSWGNPPGLCRAASRSRSTPDGRNRHIGFRAVVALGRVD